MKDRYFRQPVKSCIAQTNCFIEWSELVPFTTFLPSFPGNTKLSRKVFIYPADLCTFTSAHDINSMGRMQCLVESFLQHPASHFIDNAWGITCNRLLSEPLP